MPGAAPIRLRASLRSRPRRCRERPGRGVTDFQPPLPQPTLGPSRTSAEGVRSPPEFAALRASSEEVRAPRPRDRSSPRCALPLK
eukprot:8571347-Alexandrium_andersonii.AAC.1